MADTPTFHGTTIVSVRRSGGDGPVVAIGGDGQVTLGTIVVKASARKVRKLHRDQVLAGFAGATADASSAVNIPSTKSAWSKNAGLGPTPKRIRGYRSPTSARSM